MPYLYDIMNRWKEKTGQMFTHDEFEEAFTIKHQSIWDMYMRFIKFRFVHYRVAKKNDLCNMKISQTESCAYCSQQETVHNLCMSFKNQLKYEQILNKGIE